MYLNSIIVNCCSTDQIKYGYFKYDPFYSGAHVSLHPKGET